MKPTIASLLLAACAAQPASSPDVSFVYLTSESSVGELASATPNVRFVTGLTRETALEHAAEADAADAHLLSDEFLQRAMKLRWVQARSAGVDRYLGLERLIQSDEIVFTNMKGVHGPAIAEHVFAMLLSLTRKLHVFAAADSWDRSESEGMVALAGQTMLVVGLGGIGKEVALRADAFDMTVLATARTPRDPPPYVDRLGVAADLDAMLPEADVVVLCVPLTPQTERMFDADRFARMKPGAWLVNIARGKVVDTDALVAALDRGHLAGAALDVTDPEPLPRGHTLWSRPDVLITPHVASRGEITLARREAVFRENLRRFGRGEPLRNVVDKGAGY